MDDTTNRLFPIPSNVDEAIERRRQVADEATALQAKLRDPSPADSGMIIIDRKLRAAFREKLKNQLEALYAESRFLRDWLGRNATHKPTEYDMLGRAYRILADLEDRGEITGEEADALLADIEMHVPQAYLIEKKGAA